MMVDRYNGQFIVGCPDSDGVFTDVGKARIYRKTFFLGQPVWFETLLSTGVLASGADHFGSSVAIFLDQAFVGARTTNAVGPGVDNGGWWEFGPPNLIFEDGFQ